MCEFMRIFPNYKTNFKREFVYLYLLKKKDPFCFLDFTYESQIFIAIF